MKRLITPKGAVAGMAVLALAALALALRSPVPLALALPILVALALSVLASIASPLAVEAERAFPHRRHLTGDEAETTLSVRVAGRGAALADIRESMPFPIAPARGTSRLLARLPSRGALAAPAAYAFPARGRVRVTRLDVEARGLLGLTTRRAVAFVPTPLDVLPGAETLPALPGFERRRRFAPGPLVASRPGPGSEFFGLRRYLPGDALASVNWKATARRGHPIVNEREPEVNAAVVVMIDARAAADVGFGATSTFEAALRAAGAMAARLVRDRHRVGLLLLTDEPRWLHPAAGERQLDKIQEVLLDARARGEAPLNALLRDVGSEVLPRGSDVVLVTPAAAGDHDVPAAVRELTLRAANVLVVSPSPVAADLVAAAAPMPPAAERIARLERAHALAAVARAGATVVDWDTREALAEALARAAPAAGAARPGRPAR